MSSGNFEAVRRTPAEKALWLAVLDQALNDLTYTGYASRSEEIHAHDSAYLWLRSDSRSLGSFLFVCDVLGLDAAWFRKHLFAQGADGLRDRLVRHHRGDTV
jgi:hypothetical protein